MCSWEDDAAQLADPDLVARSNVLCLRSARREYLRTGVADPDQRARVRPPRADEIE